MELAQSYEAASKDAQMKAIEHLPSGNSAVHKVTSPSQKEACYRCGLTNHRANDCRFKEATCHSCGKKGHIKRACRSGKQFQRKETNEATPRGKERTKWVVKEQSVVLKTYTSEVIPVRGEVQVMVTYGEQKKQLTLYVTKQEGPCPLGKEWLTTIRLDWKTIRLAAMDTNQTQLNEMLKRFDEVFQDELGTMKTIKAKLRLKENATPKFH